MGVGDLLAEHLLGLDASVAHPSAECNGALTPSSGSDSGSASDDEEIVAPQPVAPPRGLSGVFRRLPRGGMELDTTGHDVRTVLINVYDVSDSEQIQKINRIFTAHDKVLVGGVFHAGVELYGVEWGFGATEEERTGVGGCAPRAHPHHTYRCTVPIGQTELNQEEVQALVIRLAKEWPGTQYHLLHRNCLNFCNAFLKELGLRKIPGWVDRASRIGSRLDTAAQMVRAIRTKEDARDQAAEAIKVLNQKAQEKIQALSTNLSNAWLPIDSTTVFPLLGARLLAKKFQDKLGDQSVISGERSKEERTIRFQPGTLGLAMTIGGKITHVGQKGQAEATGVKLGWKIIEIDGEPYTEERLDAKIFSTTPYAVVFKIAPKRSSKNKSSKKRSKDLNAQEDLDVIPDIVNASVNNTNADDALGEGQSFRCPSDSDDVMGHHPSCSAVEAN